MDSFSPTENGPSGSLVDEVYLKLRDAILRGELRQQLKLRSEALRARLGVGASPIREALNRLLAEGFVTMEAQKGFRVAPLSIADLKELDDNGSGGGTRTPDTRIMIPLL